MPAVLVIADDLTGANATGAMFARLGLRTRTAGALAAAGRPGEEPVDVLVLVTGTRQLPPRRAADRITQLLADLRPADEPELLVKRVDTTLRGPLAAELEVVLEHRRRWHSRVVALAVPAFPSAGRTTVGGLHLLHGVPLAQSAAARDPLAPVRHSRVATLLTTGTGLRARELHLDELAHAEPGELLADALAGDAEVVVVDAVSEADLTRVARAAAHARERVAGVDVVVVDSGPFGAAYCDALGVASARVCRHPVLLVVGSLAEQTREQLALAEATLGGELLEVGVDLPAGTLAGRTIAAVDAGARIVGWRTAPPAGRPDPDAAAGVPGWLATATRRVLGARQVGGVFASGGDVATAVLDALDAQGVDVEAEVQPLVVAGRITGGPWDGLPVITKGGLVGDERAVLDSITRLQSMQAVPTVRHTAVTADPSDDRKVARS